ncbi:MAG TPA: HAD-IA family hydrolase [Candidatus Binataceae bacterium]|nr:HAD-IA family hydrolase [Candidatus Binataceae bacterium]
MLKAIFFDAAGTIFDARQPIGRSYARLAREYGVDADEEAVGAAFRRVFPAAPPLAFGKGHPPAELRRLEREWWRTRVAETFAGMGDFTDFDAYFDALFAFFADPAHWRTDDEAPALLARLKDSGFALGVISNFDARVYGILEGLGLSRFFDSVTISSEAGYAKPSPRLFEVALGKHSIAPGQALHVGDSVALDIHGASAAKIPVVLFDPGKQHSLDGYPGVERISSLAAVSDIIRRSEVT